MSTLGCILRIHLVRSITCLFFFLSMCRVPISVCFSLSLLFFLSMYHVPISVCFSVSLSPPLSLSLSILLVALCVSTSPHTFSLLCAAYVLQFSLTHSVDVSLCRPLDPLVASFVSLSLFFLKAEPCANRVERGCHQSTFKSSGRFTILPTEYPRRKQRGKEEID